MCRSSYVTCNTSVISVTIITTVMQALVLSLRTVPIARQKCRLVSSFNSEHKHLYWTKSYMRNQSTLLLFFLWFMTPGSIIDDPGLYPFGKGSGRNVHFM
jgi:hypothetical protein